MNKLELISREHDRDNFDCGVQPLNVYLRHTARQHTERGISRTYVLVPDEARVPKTILGYFTLNLCQLHSDVLPPDLARKLPHEIGGIKLGRLAIAKNFQGQGFGKLLLIGALKKTIEVYDAAGGMGLFVDAKDNHARMYYQQFGFVCTNTDSLLLFLPLATIRQLVTGA